MSEVRGRSWEDPKPNGQWPRGVTPCPRSGTAAESTRLHGSGTAERSYPAYEVGGLGGGGREEIPQRLRVRGRDERSYPHVRGQGCDDGSYPASEVGGCGREEISHAPNPRPQAMGRRSYLMPLSPRPRAVAGRSNPMT